MKFRFYTEGKFHIFRGKAHTELWYVYDTNADKYVGGSFYTLKDAREYAKGKE